VSPQAQGEVLSLEGPLSFANLPEVLARSDAYCARAELPERLTIDFAGVDQVDSSAVALLLQWRRTALLLGKELSFVNLPANLLALAELYGVSELIQPPEA
jgi:phospholipid transport system transporter-binding protein